MGFDALAADYQALQHELAPTRAHLTGEYRYAERFEAGSADADLAAARRLRALCDRAEDEAAAGPARRLDLALLRWDSTARARVLESGFGDIDVNPVFGPAAALPTTVAQLPIPGPEVAAAFVPKYEAIARYFTDRARRHLDAAGRGLAAPASAIHATARTVEDWLALPLDDDPLLNLGSTPPDVHRGNLLDELRTVIRDSVRSALSTYAGSLRETVGKVARGDEECGLGGLPNGLELYQTLADEATATELPVGRIHDLGLEQVAKLRAEYAELGAEVFGTRNVAEVLAILRDDPKLHFTSATEIVTAAEAALERSLERVGDWFGVLPSAGCVVAPAHSGSLAYYFRPAKDGSRGGTFFVNVSDPAAWARYEIEALAFHEAVPGHHLQIARAAELTDVQEFRRTSYVPAYCEGWGLYAERLADEMGLYSTPLDRFGMLSFDSLRACRLVVDTGLHALGWSKQRAIDYMLANSPMSAGHVTAEVTRYVSTPGQALAYMTGRLELMRLRDETKQRLGDRFRLSAFHDVVLEAGQVPLGPLADYVAARLT
ncbi:DUF885 domain-containing protein [Kribbella sp. NPDC048928]|uniref:DUF885 domain-containing protein n=1 Tax=Kribbella sp. NPDC048928 TaxID=3364111 RepID=UPI003711EB1A